MHTEVFNNIDTLINMAGSPLNIDDINSELIILKKQIKNKRNEIEDLKSLMTEARYFNASNELVDKNIEISLKNKIARLTRKEKELKIALDELKSTSKVMHEEIASLKKKLARNEEYIATLKLRISKSSENKYYTKLLEKEEKNVELLNKELEAKEQDYAEILQELETNNKEYSGVKEKLATEKERLNEILDSLASPENYMDEDLKGADEAKLGKLSDDLVELEARKSELLSDANVIGSDIKELIVNGDIIEALAKIKELVNLVKARPFMEITSLEVLEEELEKRENERLELSTIMDSKKYDDGNIDALSKRISFLKDEMTSNNLAIHNYEAEILKLDTFVNNTLGPALSELEEAILKLESEIREYRAILKKDNKSTRTKGNIESTIQKKEKEKNILDEILEAYKVDLLAKINNSNTLSDIATTLNTTNKKYEEEITSLEKLTMIEFKTQDLATLENDKEKLKAINEEIRALKNRKKFTKTPDEIFDQIDMQLATLKPKEPEIVETKEPVPSLIEETLDVPASVNPVSLEIDNLFETKEMNLQEKINEEKNHENINEEKSQENIPTKLKVVEMIPAQTIKKSTTEVGGN